MLVLKNCTCFWTVRISWLIFFNDFCTLNLHVHLLFFSHLFSWLASFLVYFWLYCWFCLNGQLVFMFKKIQLPTRKSFLINLDSAKLPRCMLKTYSGPDTPSLLPSSRVNVLCMLTFSCSKVSYMLSAYMPTCIVCLCAQVLTCLAFLRVQVPTCSACSCPHVPTCLDCLYAYVSKWHATSCVDKCQYGLSSLPYTACKTMWSSTNTLCFFSK